MAVVSHICRAALLLATLLLAQSSALPSSPRCPGAFDFAGYGEAIARSTEKGGLVDVVDHELVKAHLNSRINMASGCRGDSFISLQLLGKKLSYMQDLSGVSCGCNAAMYLIAMENGLNGGRCDGENCDEIDIQFANRHAWHSSLRDRPGYGGRPAGFGGDSARDFNGSAYGPGAHCVDTSRPFRVEASFPVDDEGILYRMDIHFSQDGATCLAMAVPSTAPSLGRLSKVLAGGVTPVVYYYGTGDMSWLDGQGSDGKGPCKKEEEERHQKCGDVVRVWDFAVLPIDQLVKTTSTSASTAAASRGAAPSRTSPLPVPPSKPCVAGLQQHQECATSFEYNGVSVQDSGCVEEVGKLPWCSPDTLFSGNRRTCVACAPAEGGPSSPWAVQAEQRPSTGLAPCVGGWRADHECVATFTHEGQVFEGCTEKNYSPAWCSKDVVFAGSWKLCTQCAPASAPDTASAMAVTAAAAKAVAAGGWHVVNKTQVGDDVVILVVDRSGETSSQAGASYQGLGQALWNVALISVFAAPALFVPVFLYSTRVWQGTVGISARSVSQHNLLPADEEGGGVTE